MRNPYEERITVRELAATWRQAVKRVARDGQAGHSREPATASRTQTPTTPVRTM